MSDREDRVRDAVARAWQQARPLVLQHLATLETAGRSLSADALAEPQRRHAESLAHQLAGSLGTYGFRAASAHAQVMERLLSDPAAGRAHAAELLARARLARTSIEDQEAELGEG